MSIGKVGIQNGHTWKSGYRHRAAAFIAGLFAVLSSMPLAAVDIAQEPLVTASASVPGNLALVISAEAPTLVSVANLGDYSASVEYDGYFDPKKCYKYVYSATESERHFYPVSYASSHACPNTAEDANGRLWSGNFMNWAATQVIDPFRKELTGGYRVKDEVDSTWLEKAISDRLNTGSVESATAAFPRRTTPSSGSSQAIVENATPAHWGTFRTRADNLGNKMWFTVGTQATALAEGYPTQDKPMPNSAGSPVANADGNTNSPNVVAYNPGNRAHHLSSSTTICPTNYSNYYSSSSTIRCYQYTGTYSSSSSTNRVCESGQSSSRTCWWGQYTTPYAADTSIYEVSVRVAVCVPGLLEANCKQYGSNYKPEGLIQGYSEKLTYSAFSYINNGRGSLATGNPPDGGVMRAPQKFVGPNTYYIENSGVDNARKEWNPNTGQFIADPDATYLSSSSVDKAYYAAGNSGIINYINKFGQMNTGRLSKYYDNVSELYYAAFRYFRGLPNVTAYSNLSSDSTTKMQQADKFPVIRWDAANDDPIRYQCQANAILGIGDTNTAADKSLPGASWTSNVSSSGEGTLPTEPREVNGAAIEAVDVQTDWRRIMRLEKLNDPGESMKAQLSGSGNSGYIAALAYYANLRDIRPDKPGTQRVSTFWVDAVEYFDYKTTTTNQYWLAAKYGDVALTGSSLGAAPNFSPTIPLANVPGYTLSNWSASGQNVVNPNTGVTVYQRPNNFFVASDAKSMAAGLRAAFERFVGQTTGSGSALSSNTTRLTTGSMVYQAQFSTSQNNEWSGSLTAYAIDSSTGALSSTASWSAGAQFPPAGTDNTTQVDGRQPRQIWIAKNGALTAFTRANLAGTSLASATQAEVNYLRGDLTDTALRTRTSPLGDIVNSQPVYVGSPNANLYTRQGRPDFTGRSSYASFASTASSRTSVVYVGANDGMLHAFNANTGAEIFAFMPTAAMSRLLGTSGQLSTGGGYADPNYTHRYSVDGELTAADVYDTAAQAWKTILVGTLGRGGTAVFALDVTNPASPSLLWEKTKADIPELGNNLGKPIIAQLADGKWYVLLGNGPNGSDHAELITIGVAGVDKGRVYVSATNNSASNGLSGVNAWDEDGDGFVDTVYAGDLKGTMWRFASPLEQTAGQALFNAVNGSNQAQPITATPLVARDPATRNTWVFFGTGRYLSTDDVTGTHALEVQSWYGLIDDGSAISGRSQLVETDIVAEGTLNGSAVRVLEKGAGSGTRGWYIDLKTASGTAQGERMIVPNFFQGLTLIGTTRIPSTNDVCQLNGSGYTMAIDPFTGGPLAQSFFDADGDGVVGDSGDMLGGKPVSGIGYGSSPNNPVFVGDYMYTSLDDGSRAQKKTNAQGANIKRVSWREIIGE